MARSFRVGSLFGIPVTIHVSWVFILVFLVYSLGVGYFPSRLPDASPGLLWGVSLAAALLLFASLLLHELSHSLVAVRRGLPIHGITLFLFGGVSELSEEPASARTELVMAAAGPLTSLVLTAAALVASRAFGPGALHEVLRYTGVVNGMLALFNLLPGFPLDGGRILRAILWERGGDLRKATDAAAAVGRAVAAGLIALGLLNVLGGNLFSGLWLAVIGFFLQQAGQAGKRQADLTSLLHGVDVSRVMVHDFVAVAPEATLDVLAEEYILRHHHETFPVLEGDRLAGLVRIDQVKVVERARWGSTPVSSIMRRDTGPLEVRPGTPARDALAVMLKEGWQVLPVVDAGRLTGIVSLRDIMHTVQLRSDLLETK